MFIMNYFFFLSACFLWFPLFLFISKSQNAFDYIALQKLMYFICVVKTPFLSLTASIYLILIDIIYIAIKQRILFVFIVIFILFYFILFSVYKMMPLSFQIDFVSLSLWWSVTNAHAIGRSVKWFYLMVCVKLRDRW